MATNNKKFEFNLDFLLNLKMDNAKIERLVSEINKIMQKVDPNLDFNSEDFKKSVDNVVKALSQAENGVMDIEQLLSAMEMDIDFNNSDAILKAMAKTLSEMEQVDLDNLKNSIKQLEDIDVNSQFNELENALKDVDLSSIADEMNKLNSDDNFVKSVEKLADGVNKAEDELKDYIKTNKTAMQGMKDSGQEGSEAYKKMEDEIKSAEEALNKMNDTAKDLGSSGSFIENMFKFEAIGQAADQLKQLSESGIEFRDTLLNVGGQIGLSADELEKFKDRALDAFGNGIGGSVAEATKALGTAQQMLGNFLDEKQLMDFTKGAAAIGQVFDKDINEVIGGSRTFISTFGLEGQQAFELVGLAMQKSGSKMDDTLDTLDEYSVLLKRAGFEGAESIGLISNAMELGQRDTDKLADAIKETNIRLMEGDASKELTDAIAIYGNEMPSALAKTLQSIIKAGEEGKKSTKEVMQESSSAILTSFDNNQINDVMRDKLARTISGTMAEDMGGEMWTKIFSAKIDASTIEAQAKTAGDQIANALGPVTVMEKFQRQIEGLWTEASLNIAPYTSQLATGLSSVASVAPAIQLLKDTNLDWLKDGAKNALSFGTTLLQKLVPSLFIQTAATEAGAVAQTKLNLAVLANPYVLAAAGLAALVGGLIYYVNWLDEAETRKLDSIKSEQELAEKQIENNKQQQDRISKNQELIKSYEELGSKTERTAAEEEKYRQTQIALGQSYPDIIKKGNDFNTTLAELKNVAIEGKGELTKLQEEANKLQLDKKKLQVELEKQEVTVGLKEIKDLIEEETEDFLGGDTPLTFKINKDIFKPYADALKNAKNDKEIQDATFEFQKAITTIKDEDLSPEAKSKIIGQATKMADAQAEALKAQEGVIQEQSQQLLNKAFESGTIDENVLQGIVNQTGISIDKLTDMMNTKKDEIQSTKLGEIIKDSVKVEGNLAEQTGIDQLLENYQNATTEIEKARISQAIANIAPTAAKSTKVVVDENGKLIQSYEISSDKIKESAEAEKQRQETILNSKFDEINALYKEEIDIYDSGIAKLKEMEAEINKKKSLGIDTTQLEADYEKVRQETYSAQDDIVKAGAEMINKGMKADSVYLQMSKTLKKSPEQVKALIEAQKGSLKEGEKQLTQVEQLAKRWAEATSASSKTDKDARQAALQLNNDIKKAKADGDKEEVKRLIQLRDEQIKTARQAYAETLTNQKAEKALNELIEGKEDVRWAKAKEAFETKKSDIEFEQRNYELLQKESILEDKRARNSYDDLVLSKEKLETNKKTLKQFEDELIARNLAKRNDSGAIEITTKVSKDKIEIEKQLREIGLSIKDSSFAVAELQAEIKVDDAELEKAYQDLKVKQLEFSFEATLDTSKLNEVVGIYRNKYEEVKNSVISQEETITALEKKRTEAQTDAQRLAYDGQIIEAKKKLVELQTTEIDARGNINTAVEKLFTEKKKVIDESYESEKTKLDENFTKQMDIAKKFTDVIKQSMDVGIESDKDKSLKALEEEQAAKIKMVEQSNEMMSLSGESAEKRKLEIEKEYQKKKLDAEEEYQNKKKVAQALADAAELEMNRMKLVKETELDQKRVTETQKMLLAKASYIDMYGKPIFSNAEDQKTFDELQKQYDKNIEVLATKGDIMADVYGTIETISSEGIANMFAGNWEEAGESLKTGLRSIFAIMAKALSTELSAVVTKMVLKWLSLDADALPIYAKIALIPAMQGLASLAVNTLASPVINTLTSFASGGEINSPTLALVGDGAKLGSQNKEWIFRNDQLQATLQMAVARQSMGMDSRLLEIRDALNKMQLETTLKGQDIKISYHRTNYKNQARAK